MVADEDSGGDTGALIKAAYESHRARIKASLLLEYRCPQRGCLLLHVWRSPAGLMYYRPRPLSAGLLADIDPAGVVLECDHKRLFLADTESIRLRPVGWWAFEGDLGAYAPLVIAAGSVSLVGYSSAIEASAR